jgi:tetratricopeptide (TPR) repeat protein
VCEPASEICGVYRDLKSLCDHLKQLPNIQRRRREGFVRDDFTLNVLCHLPDPSTLSAQSSDTATKRQETEFMYAQLLRDILVKIESTEEEMIKFCREKCTGNNTDLNTIDQFEEYYDACNAIFWYTRDTFLYRLLNQALRNQEFDTLYSLRYFIKDLHFQLIKRRASQFLQLIQFATVSDVTDPSIPTVYRGQLMTNEEFNKKIRNNEKGFLSINSFFSTTSHRHLAIVYAGNRSSSKTSTEQSVLFQIEIRKNYHDYANISEESAFEEDEGEILFTMGAVFRIVSVDLSDEGFWDVKMRLSPEEDEELTTLAAHVRAQIITPYPLLSLGRFMLETANYDKAEQLHLLSLNELTIREKYDIIPAVYNDLGFIYKKTGKQEKAIEHYKKSLETYLKHLPPTDTKLACVHNNLGVVYCEQGDYDKALSCYNKALEIELNSPIPAEREIALYYNNIGIVYQAQQCYLEALERFEKSLELLEKRLPVNHPSIAVIYNNISTVHHALGNCDKANDYLKKTLEIQLRSLSPNHPDLATSYNNLGFAYKEQSKFQEALEMYEKCLQIQSKYLPSNHPDIATTNNNISQVRSIMERMIRQLGT